MEMEFFFFEIIILVLLHKCIKHSTLVQWLTTSILDLFVEKILYRQNTEIALNAMWESDKFETLKKKRSFLFYSSSSSGSLNSLVAAGSTTMTI